MTQITKINSWRWIDYQELDSTNDEALRLSQSENKLIVTSQIQTKGKGRLGRKWESFEGNLFMSMLMSWPLSENNALVFIISLALRQTIKKMLPQADVKIKWPNDVLVNDKKISGILLETGEQEKIVVGIGVNIKKHPENIIYPTTSLLKEGKITDRVDFIKMFIGYFDEVKGIYNNKGMDEIVKIWQSQAKGIGEKIKITILNKEETGVFDGIDNDGRLILNIDGNIKIYNAGDVFFIGKKN
ncbi:MAG: biotin--[acetyl-CoA-carboxylase] ligase [Alphaproteobacteria bacterium]|nr:biotin--[acetyl-CoA-carboxylase] ligase [Alphaproteobacteria bacterium]